MIAADLPQVTVNVGRVELMLSNLLSNAIKYSDPAKAHRFVEVSLVELHESACTDLLHAGRRGPWLSGRAP